MNIREQIHNSYPFLLEKELIDNIIELGQVKV